MKWAEWIKKYYNSRVDAAEIQSNAKKIDEINFWSGDWMKLQQQPLAIQQTKLSFHFSSLEWAEWRKLVADGVCGPRHNPKVLLLVWRRAAAAAESKLFFNWMVMRLKGSAARCKQRMAEQLKQANQFNNQIQERMNLMWIGGCLWGGAALSALFIQSPMKTKKV